MEKIITEDNAITFHNEKYDETYHSTSGAIEEAFEKFVKPCKLKDGMKVLDICFGLGYNSLAAISLANVEITGLENDSEILKQLQNINVPKNYQNIENLNENYEKIKLAAKNFSYSDDKIKLKIILGDARETIKNINEKFDAVFLDPFSPKKCPELWTKEFFKDIGKSTKNKGILTTYSCSKLVRNNLKYAGFRVEDGPCIGRKSPSTIAYRKLFIF